MKDVWLKSFAVVLGAITPGVTALADIVIGTAGPMSGQFAPFGEQMRAGAEQAIADINASGGVNNRFLVLETADDACNEEKAVAIANQMVGKEIAFMAGHFCFEPSYAASKIYAAEGIVQISPATTNPKFTEERSGPGIFRLYGRDDRQGVVAGELLAAEYAGKNIAFIHDGSAYGKGLVDAAKAIANRAGVVETLYEGFPPGEKDYSGLIWRLNAEAVDAVFIGGHSAEAGTIRKQMTEQGMAAVMIGGDALADDEFWATTGRAGEGTLLTAAPDPRQSPAAAKVIAALETAEKPADGYALYTYAAIQAWAAAANAAGTNDHDAVAAALGEGVFETILGTVSFDDKGDVNLPSYVWYEWSKGKYDYR